MTYLERAQRADPAGCVCGYCGGLNDLADHRGFQYTHGASDVKRGVPTCKTCHDGLFGWAHKKKYGTGDR